jgi:hypothetical protein
MQHARAEEKARNPGVSVIREMHSFGCPLRSDGGEAIARWDAKNPEGDGVNRILTGSPAFLSPKPEALRPDLAIGLPLAVVLVEEG